MVKFLADDQPVPDDENARKPAILKHHSIILTDEELKELGMKDLTENEITNCEITEEEESDIDADCEENPIVDDGEENELSEKDKHNEDCNHEANDSNPDIDVSTVENHADDCNKLKDESNIDAIEDNNILDDETGNADDCKDENESNENQPDPECSAVLETVGPEVSETVGPEALETVGPEVVVNEVEVSKDIEKPIEIKPKQLSRPISGHKFKIPAMWTPGNSRANAAFVYIFFRHVSILIA